MKKQYVLFLLLLLIGCTKLEEVQRVESEVPVFRISTKNNLPVNSKTTYQAASLTIEGKESSTYKIEIRGRGNTTWSFPKKPFKIKLAQKAGLLNGRPSKEWVLLANYLDPSLMHNAVAMRIGNLLNMPFTNTIKPVNLWLNHEFLGNYTLTEQVEAKENRVEVGEDGILLSLDTIIDPDDYYFISTVYRLPVIIKYPKSPTEQRQQEIRRDFGELEQLVSSPDFPNATYLDKFDADAMAAYLIVYTLTCNEEINHPKSTYIHKKSDGKYTIGPIWDFDWAFSYEASRKHYVDPLRPLFWKNSARGTVFFERIAMDPQIKSRMKAQWQNFRINHFSSLLNYVDMYAEQIEASRKADYRKWQRGASDFNLEKEELINWLELRAKYLDKLVASW